MPNWCSTIYHVVGDKKEVQALKKVLDANYRRKTPRIPDFETMCIVNIIDALGYDWTKYPCVGWIGDWWMSDDVLVIEQRTAWHEQEGFREVIQKKFPNLIVYFQDQDLFGGYCATNSFDEFPDRYVFLNNDGEYYFQTIEEAAKFVSDIVGYVVEDSEEAIDIALDKYMSAVVATYDKFVEGYSFRLLNTTPSADAPE